MERIIYIICQKKLFNKGNPQVLSDGKGKILYIFASKEGKIRAEKLVKNLNKDYRKQQVHLRKVKIIFKEELKSQITGEEAFEEHKKNCGCCEGEDKSKEAGE